MSDAVLPAAGALASRPAHLRALERLCRLSAAAGGLAIFLVACAVTVSVVMRNLGLGGIRGDFELVEFACAICASLFLPLCQISRGHVMVDLFTTRLPRAANRFLDGLWELVFALALAGLGWRLALGGMEMLDYGDATMLLGLPLWLAYAPAVFGTALSAAIGLGLASEMLRGRDPQIGGM